MRFTKMHGIGNDYIYVNGFAEQVDDPPAVARAISDRHFGVGADGLILILPPDQPAHDARMRMFNADGSEAQMCGNGIRCLAKYVHDRGISHANPLRVETLAGLRFLELGLGADGTVQTVRVDMGRPVFETGAIPTTLGGRRAVLEPIEIDGHTWQVTCVSMGNPHAVFFVPDVADVPLEQFGPRVERDPHFPQRVNVHVIHYRRRRELTVRTWERGSGITLACGTGACAVVAAGAILDRTDRRARVRLPGGALELDWAADDHIYLTGPATEVFTGDWPGEPRGEEPQMNAE
jgi:diaminopimelate epimerase